MSILRVIYHLFRYGIYYHVEVMNGGLDPEYKKLTSTVVFQSSCKTDSKAVADFFKLVKGKKVRTAIIAGYLDD